MQELNIKGYYDKKLGSSNVDVRSSVMNRIKRNENRKLSYGKRVVAILVAAMIFILGCGYAINQTFFNPQGDVLWEKIFTDESLEYQEIAYDVFQSLELEEGNIVKILVKDNNPDQMIMTFQEPMTSIDFSYTADLIKGIFELDIQQNYNSFTFSNMKRITHSGMNIPTEMDSYLTDNLGDQEYIYQILENTPADFDKITLIYESKNSTIDINIFTWTGKKVYYNIESQNEMNKKIDINGYEGLITSKDDLNQLEMMIDDVYVTINYPGNVILDEEMIGIVKAILDI